MLAVKQELENTKTVVRACIPLAFLDSFLYLLVKLMNYGNMLIAMTFNVGIIMTMCTALSVFEAFRMAAMDRLEIKK